MSWVTLFLWCFEVLFFIFNSYSLIIVCLDIGLYVVHWIWICMFSSVLRFGEFGPCVLAPLLNFQIYIIYVLLLWSLVKSPKSHNYSQLPSFTFFLPLFQFQMHNLQESCFSTCSNLLLNYLTINDFSAFSPPHFSYGIFPTPECFWDHFGGYSNFVHVSSWFSFPVYLCSFPAFWEFSVAILTSLSWVQPSVLL